MKKRLVDMKKTGLVHRKGGIYKAGPGVQAADDVTSSDVGKPATQLRHRQLAVVAPPADHHDRTVAALIGQNGRQSVLAVAIFDVSVKILDG